MESLLLLLLFFPQRKFNCISIEEINKTRTIICDYKYLSEQCVSLYCIITPFGLNLVNKKIKSNLRRERERKYIYIQK